MTSVITAELHNYKLKTPVPLPVLSIVINEASDVIRA